MSELDPLHRMNETKLRAWLLARMRGVDEDPPVSEMHMESPDDYVAVVYEQSRSKAFRARLAKAVVAAIEEAAKGKLRGGRDARAIRYLAELADSLELDAAAPVLHALAEQGALGGHDDALDHDAEELVLFALAGLQEPGVLFAKWLALWERDLPHLWPVVTAGLRLSDPKRALAILPEAVRRGASHPGFPYGEVLWAYATDERYAAGDFAAALTGLPREALQRCRSALQSLGATDADIVAWVPTSRRLAYPRRHFAEGPPLLARERPARPYGVEARAPETPMTTAPITLFFSYSHKDERFRDQLETHLASLENQGFIESWHDRKILPGREWAGDIDENLEKADVILLLVSADFLASDYCFKKEAARALERHEAGDARVIPVLLKSVDWSGAPFAKLQALPRDAKPVSTWTRRSDAWTDVAMGIRRAVEALRARRSR